MGVMLSTFDTFSTSTTFNDNKQVIEWIGYPGLALYENNDGRIVWPNGYSCWSSLEISAYIIIIIIKRQHRFTQKPQKRSVFVEKNASSSTHPPCFVAYLHRAEEEGSNTRQGLQDATGKFSSAGSRAKSKLNQEGAQKCNCSCKGSSGTRFLFGGKRQIDQPK
ncbi:uncharacterized protein LOC111254251 [Varroa destructor]|uniref:Uncharacterized protein n=1 Tax=Varroa destructor TaxID=109461 RepID=A0A7M7MJC3_VARDE|nr:uncharacterized protein LOC111254251 [Varroa destructor]